MTTNEKEHDMIDSAANELQLLTLAHAGDTDALNELFGLYRPMARDAAESLIPFGFQSLFPPSDLVQEALLDASQSLPTLRNVTIAGFRAWLMGILNHNLEERLRYMGQKKRDSNRVKCDSSCFESISCDDVSPQRAVEQGELVFQLQECVEQLPTQHQIAIWLFYRDGLTYVEISEQMATSVSTVHRLLRSARESLRGLLPGGEYD
jgi:RNA polymerase sigma-70 factor, ECF subfamily